jgi:hypothetical protein
MKPEQADEVGTRGIFGLPEEISLENLQPPEIVGQVDNPVLEAARRLWWRGLDRVCGFFVLIRLYIFDRIYGPEPLTSDDVQREPNHERFVRAFPAISERSNRETPCEANETAK